MAEEDADMRAAFEQHCLFLSRLETIYPLETPQVQGKNDLTPNAALQVNG